MTGCLYVVATPLGNLQDMTPRAVTVLQSVTAIAAEDTRHSGRLCQQFGVITPLISLHDHNERDRVAPLVARLEAGEDIALISDAGTPLISDPGYRLVRAARMARIPVFAVPGPSAVVAALSVAGIASDRFAFEGFPPAQRGARRAAFIELAHEPRTLVFYESPHRLAACLADLAEIFGDEREATLVREITKRFEEGVWATLGILRDRALAQEIKGECVLVIAGAPPVPPQVDNGHLLSVLLAEIPLRQAVDLAVQLTGCNRKMLYAQALALKANAHSGRET